MLPRGVRGKRDPVRGGAHGLHAQHLRGEIANRLRNSLFLRFPALSTNLAQRRFRSPGSNIFLHQVHPQRRHIQFGRALKLQREIFHLGMCRALHHAARSIIRGASTLPRATCSIKRSASDQSHILRHAVIAVGDVITFFKMQERVARPRTRRDRAPAPAHAKAPKQLMLGNKHQ